MSYSIYLSIMCKDVYNNIMEHINNGRVRELLPNSEDPLLFDDIVSRHAIIETDIPNSIDIEKFDQIELPENAGLDTMYVPFILDTKAFYILLKEYQEYLYDVYSTLIADYEYTDKILSKIKNDTDKMYKLSTADKYSVENAIIHKLFEVQDNARYFNNLRKSTKLTMDASTYLFQYFWLVTIYMQYNDDDKYVFIITHG